MPMDVLVHVLGRGGQVFQINASSTVTKEGDIILNVSRYDPTLYDSVQLVIVPILPDRAFTVVWDQIPTGATDIDETNLPEFERCYSSAILRQRYRACNREGTGWPSKPFSVNISTYFTNFHATFGVAINDSKEEPLWSSRAHKLRLQFGEVDSPAAWAAQDYGCGLLNSSDRSLREEAEFAIEKSADALCSLVEQGCAEQNAHSMCVRFRKALENAPHLGHGIPASLFLKALLLQVGRLKL